MSERPITRFHLATFVIGTVAALLLSSWFLFALNQRLAFSRDHTIAFLGKKGIHIPNVPTFIFPPICAITDISRSLSGQSYCLKVHGFYWARAPKVPLAADVLAGLGLVVFLVGLSLAYRPIEKPAEGRLANRDDLMKNGWLAKSKDGKPTDGGIFIGLYPADYNPQEDETSLIKPPKKQYTLQIPERELERHILVEAGTREGKTSTYVKNVVFSAAYQGHTVIIWDQKFRDLTGLVETIGFYKYYNRNVFVFAPFEEDSARIPMLDQVTDFRSAKYLAEALIAPSADESVDYYRQTERELFAILALGVAHKARKEGRPGRISEIIDLINVGGLEGIANFIQDAREGVTDENADPFYWGKSIFFGDNKARVNQSKLMDSLVSLRKKLSLFRANPNLDRATSRGAPHENLDLRGIFEGKYGPSLLYIGIPRSEMLSESTPVLLRLIKITIDRVINEVAEERGRLPHQTHYILDEFQNFGEIPRIAESLAIDGSKGLSYTLLIQDRSVLFSIYGKPVAESILGNNTGNKLFYVGGLAPEVISDLEKIMGKKSYKDKNERFDHDVFYTHLKAASEGYKTKSVLPLEAMQRAPRGTVLARLHYVPWFLYQAVILEDPRNPFHKDYLALKRQAPEYAALWRKKQQPASTPSHDEPAVALDFWEWLDRLIDSNAPVYLLTSPFKQEYVIIDQLNPERVPEHFKPYLELTRFGSRIKPEYFKHIHEQLESKLRLHSDRVKYIKAIADNGKGYYVTVRGATPISTPFNSEEEGNAKKSVLDPKSVPADFFLDTSSGDLYIRKDLVGPLEASSSKNAHKYAQHMGLPEGYVLVKSQSMAFGLIPVDELVRHYDQVTSTESVKA